MKDDIITAKITRKKTRDGYRKFRFNRDENNLWDGITIWDNDKVICNIDIDDDGEIRFYNLGKNVRVDKL